MGHDSGGAGRRSGAVGGVRGGDVRAAGPPRSAGQGRDVRARVAAGRAAQVDAADGRTARCGSPGVAAVRVVLHLGGGAGARAAGPPGGRGDRPDAWVVDDTGFPKDGTASPGVARQYSGTLGKVGNCQIGVSISAVTDAASCPLSWRLFVPERWDDTLAATPEAAATIRDRPSRAGIPAAEGHREEWRPGPDK